MPQAVDSEEKGDVDSRNAGGVIRSLLPRTIGLILLLVLFHQIDASYLFETLKSAQPGMILAAVILLIALIGVKTIRWQTILEALNLSLTGWEAFLAYFAGIFIGFLTPGRLGEFGRALYLRQEEPSQPGMAFSSVLADRLFDLYTLLIVGSAAIFAIGMTQYRLWTILFFALSLLPLALFLHDASFNWLQNSAGRRSRVGRKIFDSEGWLVGVRRGLQNMGTKAVVVCAFLTIAAYVIYFSQCFLLAQSLSLGVSYDVIMFSVALGSLITLLPFSISGLGTREATIVTYLSSVGVTAEKALSFSFLVFITFYVVGGLAGAIAWMVHPIHLDFKRGEVRRD